MLTENREIVDKIDKLLGHFFNYLFSKTVKDISATANIKQKTWDYINGLKNERTGLYSRRSYRLDEIYQIIIPFVEFIIEVNKSILPHVEDIVRENTPKLSLSPQERQVRNMLADNYKENIYRLGSILIELYEITVSEDIKINSDSTPLCLTIKEIKNFENDLKFIEDYQTLGK